MSIGMSIDSTGAGLPRGIGGGIDVDARGITRTAVGGIGGGSVRFVGGRGSGGGSATTVRGLDRGDRESGWSLFESDVDIVFPSARRRDVHVLRGFTVATTPREGTTRR